MADGRAALRAQIARLRKLSGLTKDVAPKVARAVERELRAQIAAGKGPDGKPWKRRQDGGQPLRNAAAALSVRAVGDVIVVRLDGVEARHHLGAVRGGVRRQIIPTGSMPDALTRAIEEVVTREFRSIMGAAA